MSLTPRPLVASRPWRNSDRRVPDSRRRRFGACLFAGSDFNRLADPSLASAARWRRSAPPSHRRRANYEPANVVPPEPAREFRAAWVATVANIDWPSQKALSTQEQKAELLAILDRAAQLKLNAIIFQVRPACDALYASRIEPWSEYLTGTMGKAAGAVL